MIRFSALLSALWRPSSVIIFSTLVVQSALGYRQSVYHGFISCLLFVSSRNASPQALPDDTNNNNNNNKLYLHDHKSLQYCKSVE